MQEQGWICGYDDIVSLNGDDYLNPWETIDLSDYENHMSLDSVYQLQALNEIVKNQLNTYKVKTAMILGIAGGNGLEHANHLDKVYGVDVNPQYLQKCMDRYPQLEGVLETICVDLLCDNLQLPNAELLVANLLIEYIGYECFQKVVGHVKPKYISCVIQINTDDSFVSDSPYLHVFDCLEEVHHQMEEQELVRCMQKIGYQKGKIEERKLPNGKKFVRIDFAR